MSNPVDAIAWAVIWLAVAVGLGFAIAGSGPGADEHVVRGEP